MNDLLKELKILEDFIIKDPNYSGCNLNYKKYHDRIEIYKLLKELGYINYISQTNHHVDGLYELYDGLYITPSGYKELHMSNTARIIRKIKNGFIVTWNWITNTLLHSIVIPIIVALLTSYFFKIFGL